MNKAQFTTLLSRYDCSLEDVDYDVLETDPNGNNVITDDPSTSFCRYRTLETSDLDQVKHWLGNADKLYEEGRLEEPQLALEVSEASADTDQIPTIVMAAKHYVYGHSKRVSHLKDSIEKHLGPFKIHLLTANVWHISDCVTLEGDVPKVITVDKIVFEGKNAQLISYVNLTLQANEVEIK